MTDSPKIQSCTSIFSRTPRELRINCEEYTNRRKTPGHSHKKTTPVISPPIMPKKKILLRHSNYIMKMSPSTPMKVKNSIGVQTDLMFSLLPFPFPYTPTNIGLVPPPPLLPPPPPPPTKRHRYPLRNKKKTEKYKALNFDDLRGGVQGHVHQTEEVNEGKVSQKVSHQLSLPTVKVIPAAPSQQQYPSLTDRMGGTRKRKRIGSSESPEKTFRHRKRLPDGYLDRIVVEKKFGQKTRNSLSSVDVLKNWFLDNLSYPYPTKEEKAKLQKKTGLTLIQITNWCSNCRKRIWRPSVNQRDRELRETTFSSFNERLPPKKRRKIK